MDSYNGWAASPRPKTIGIVPLEVTIAGVTYAFPGGCRGGDVHTIFTHFLVRYHQQVESLGLDGADEWGFAYRKNRNADNLSCHASGTAVDVNSDRHPNGAKRTLTAQQLAALRHLLAFYEGVLKWGGDFTGTKDEMHYEINGGPADVARIARKITATMEEPEMTEEQNKLLVEIHKIVVVTDDRVNKLKQEFDEYVKTHP